MKDNKIYEILCEPILDEIYFICYEHRDILRDLITEKRCYLNSGMLGYKFIAANLDKVGVTVEETKNIDDELFKKHKSLLSVMNPKLDENCWVKLSLER